MTGVQQALLHLTQIIQTGHTHPDVKAWAEKAIEGHGNSVVFKDGKIGLIFDKGTKMHNAIVALRKAMPRYEHSTTDREVLMEPRLALMQSTLDVEDWVVLFASGLLHLPYKVAVDISCTEEGRGLCVRAQMGWRFYIATPQLDDLGIEDSLIAPINF